MVVHGQVGADLAECLGVMAAQEAPDEAQAEDDADAPQESAQQE
ncbi:hypothetical protein [Actinacidiphila soli]|nr:hypothetical protein [Actinacidiphila soli]